MLVCGLALIAVLGAIVIWPTLSREYLRRVAIPRHGESFGFTFGPIGDTTQRQWGFTHVMPGGALERAGVRAGDVPFEYHGGEAALYTVLVAGRGRFLVVQGGVETPNQATVREIALGDVTP